MDKQQLISLVKEQVASGQISKSEMLAIFAETGEGHTSKNVSNIFYIIGAVIVIIGVMILTVQNWDQIGMVGRILVTLGISLVAYVSAYLTQAKNALSQVMFAVSAVLAPVGAFVLVHELDVKINLSVNLFIAVALFAVFLVSKIILKKEILLFVSVVFGSWTYYSIILKLFGETVVDTEMMKWATIFWGTSLIAIGFSKMRVEARKNIISSLMYAFGTIAIMLPVISMDGIFNLVFFAVIFAGFYGSIFLKSRSMLVLSAIFLMAHLVKLTGEYFADSIGWPVALIFLGFVVIGVGYGTIALNRKYLRK